MLKSNKLKTDTTHRFPFVSNQKLHIFSVNNRGKLRKYCEILIRIIHVIVTLKFMGSDITETVDNFVLISQNIRIFIIFN